MRVCACVCGTARSCCHFTQNETTSRLLVLRLDSLVNGLMEMETDTLVQNTADFVVSSTNITRSQIKNCTIETSVASHALRARRDAGYVLDATVRLYLNTSVTREETSDAVADVNYRIRQRDSIIAQGEVFFTVRAVHVADAPSANGTPTHSEIAETTTMRLRRVQLGETASHATVACDQPAGSAWTWDCTDSYAISDWGASAFRADWNTTVGGWSGECTWHSESYARASRSSCGWLPCVCACRAGATRVVV